MNYPLRNYFIPYITKWYILKICTLFVLCTFLSVFAFTTKVTATTHYPVSIATIHTCAATQHDLTLKPVPVKCHNLQQKISWKQTNLGRNFSITTGPVNPGTSKKIITASATITTDPGQITSTAVCPTGTTLSGGSFYVENAGSNPSQYAIFENRPASWAPNSAWTASMNGRINMTLTTYALCQSLSSWAVSMSIIQNPMITSPHTTPIANK